ncbi:hypothetical protein [Glycomyces arizonensis]|uniref:hypothetical protein n=1 Tax=Glycomyces arizonensis TaxID=256035 RepID=UPI000423085F|nr:hypothetical protein [Glycomyces arizonensis]
MQTLRLVLLAQTALTAYLWVWVWRGLQSFAWMNGGVETDLLDRSLSYLIVLVPSIPVNLLAVVWLARGGHRARLYLACAGVLVAVQQILLLTPLDPGGSIAAGLEFFVAVGPPAFAGLALAMTPRAKRWLREDRPRTARRVASVEGLAWGLAAVLAVGVAASMDRWVTASTETGPPVGEYDESDVWARMEAAVTATLTSADTFPGFDARTVQVTSCGYRTDAGLSTFRYRIAYELAAFAGPTGEAAYAAAVRSAWSTDGYRLVYDGTTAGGAASISAERQDELRLHLVLGESAELEVDSGCLERVDPRVHCLAPQGGVAPENDTVVGLACPKLD